MTAVIFNEWLTALNSQMRVDDHKILLLLDNFSGHTSAVKSIVLSNILVHFFPPKMTGVQPCDAGIIWAFKAHCCHDFIARAIRWYEDHPDWTSKQVYDIKILEAMQMADRVWKQVTPDTIKNCWIHTGILSSAHDCNQPSQVLAPDIYLESAVQAVEKHLEDLQRCSGLE